MLSLIHIYMLNFVYFYDCKDVITKAQYRHICVKAPLNPIQPTNRSLIFWVAGQYSLPIPLRVGGWVDLSGRCHTKMGYLQMTTHLSTWKNSAVISTSKPTLVIGTIFLQTLVLIALAVFLLEHGQTDTQAQCPTVTVVIDAAGVGNNRAWSGVSLLIWSTTQHLSAAGALLIGRCWCWRWLFDRWALWVGGTWRPSRAAMCVGARQTCSHWLRLHSDAVQGTGDAILPVFSLYLLFAE